MPRNILNYWTSGSFKIITVKIGRLTYTAYSNCRFYLIIEYQVSAIDNELNMYSLTKHFL